MHRFTFPILQKKLEYVKRLIISVNYLETLVFSKYFSRPDESGFYPCRAQTKQQGY